MLSDFDGHTISEIRVATSKLSI